jgi:hypothetical protein
MSFAVRLVAVSPGMQTAWPEDGRISVRTEYRTFVPSHSFFAQTPGTQIETTRVPEVGMQLVLGS